MRGYKKTKVFLSVIVLVLAIGAGFYYWRATGSASADHGATRLGTVTREDLVQQITLAGRIIPARKTVITPPYNGYIRKIYVNIGEKVKEGQPLVTIAPSLTTPDRDLYPIRAPFSGIVVQVLKSPGEYVASGAATDAIMRVDDRTQLFVDATVPELDIVKVKEGQEAIVRASAILGRSYKAEVREISLAAKDQAASNGFGGGSATNAEFTVKLEILDPDDELKSGMSTLMDLVAAKRENVLTLAHEFLQKDAGKFFVTMKNGERRPIEVGLQNEEKFEIVSGLSEGDEVRQTDFLALTEKK